MTNELPAGRRLQNLIYRAGLYGRRPHVPVNSTALYDAAAKKMSPRARGYINGSAGTEATAAANRTAFDRWQLVPRMATPVTVRDTSVTLFGEPLDSPFVLAPIGVAEMVHQQADLATAEAAATTRTPMTVSTQASVPMEKIAAKLAGTPWYYQLYWGSSDEVAFSMVRRAEAAGASAIVVTLDTFMLGWRTQDLDNGFLPFAHGMGIGQYTSDPEFAKLVEARLQATSPKEKSSDEARPTLAAVRALMNMSRRYPGSLRQNLRSPYPRAAVETFLEIFSRTDLGWTELARLRDTTDLPIMIKGIQHADDARQAQRLGFDALWISNHGGRQLDGAIPSLDALVDVRQTVGAEMLLIFDSGVRTAADAIKALALGASAVAIGRPYLYGLALHGAAGVSSVLDYFAAELDISLGLMGVSDIADLDEQHIRPARS
ncbi:alpha-hydroxy acid oxidase [Enteractinococcus fodinae]|uniref:Isopentenyl diphosphate isomerase/L-lactate dehydrogenase-like FMN-dependent dehydrogenase n=1 Tax=Enteractinococcus fodinae TaxID=684663 RepID=A0ABU2B3E5_9MICC|nr:alpha-hydroxy-acid oxidizing protein [Enteractinococcus fodinae]MDR7348112.1 isopentenyl diphosphate isomerase/L-lactate dehydrogenase-like FMN-dependent dehydrogenase [Enteractinococcus fodinae]